MVTKGCGFSKGLARTLTCKQVTPSVTDWNVSPRCFVVWHWSMSLLLWSMEFQVFITTFMLTRHFGWIPNRSPLVSNISWISLTRCRTCGIGLSNEIHCPTWWQTCTNTLLEFSFCWWSYPKIEFVDFGGFHLGHVPNSSISTGGLEGEFHYNFAQLLLLAFEA